MSESRSKLLAIIGRISKRDSSTIKVEHELVADLGIDSPKSLDLLISLEKEFKIELPDDALTTIVTVGDILALIETPATVNR